MLRFRTENCSVSWSRFFKFAFPFEDDSDRISMFTQADSQSLITLITFSANILVPCLFKCKPL